MVPSLRIAPGRLRLWGLGLAVLGLAPVLGAFVNGFHDWPAFWSAGATVETADLVEAGRHAAWQQAHGLPSAFFAYPAGAAWLFAPFASLPLPVGFVLFGALMAACAGAAGGVGARVYGLPSWTGVLAVLAFTPVTASVVLGQNGPLGLLLALVAIDGLAATDRGVARGRWQAGLAVGLLLFKPTWGLPLVGLLVLRRRWVELAIVAVVAAGWYLAGVAAAAGDWWWPRDWLGGLGTYLAADFAGNADKAVSLPGLMARLPVPAWVPVAAGAAVVVVALPRLVRAPTVEAASAACLVGVAVSPHAWGYDAALVVPWLLWAIAGGVAEPWRTRIVVAAYALGPLWLVSRQTVISAVALVVLGLTVAWLTARPGGQAAEVTSPRR